MELPKCFEYRSESQQFWPGERLQNDNMASINVSPVIRIEMNDAKKLSAKRSSEN